MFLSDQQIRKFWERNYPGMNAPKRSTLLIGLVVLAAYFGYAAYCYISWRFAI